MDCKSLGIMETLVLILLKKINVPLKRMWLWWRLLMKKKGNLGNKPPLLLLSHIDVVPVEEEKWTYPPFSGKIVEKEIWGRGALDCKSLGVMETLVLILLKKINVPLKRDVVMAATADEEQGGQSGVAWLCKNRPEFNQFEVVINEGGGVGLARKTKNFYLCQAGEKGLCWFRIIFKGTPGHGSTSSRR